MANDDRPRGLVPLDWPYTQTHAYRINTGGDVFMGQAVDITSNGFVSAVTMTGLTATIGIVVGFAGPAVSGLASNAPFLDVSDITPPTSGQQSGDRYAIVADNPNQQYYIQEDTGGTALVIGDAGSGYDLVYRGPTGTSTNGDSNSGWANVELDRSTVVTGTGVFVQALRLMEVPNSDGSLNAPGNFAKWVVKPLQHRWNGTPVPNAPV